MNYRELGSTGIKVSEVCLGTWTISGRNWVGLDDEESIRTIATALDEGINIIDTAYTYGFGHAEKLIGEAIKGRREEVVICDKVANRKGPDGNMIRDCSYDFIMRTIEECLNNLQTDYIDVFLIHDYNKDMPLKETMGAMTKLLDEKVVRNVGVSRFDVPRLKEAGEYARLSVGQYPLSIFSDNFFCGVSDNQEDNMHPIKPAIDYCMENNIGIMAYGGMEKGLLAGRFTGSETFPVGDIRRDSSQYQGEEFKERIKAVDKIRPIAEKYGKTLGQVAINWVLCKDGITAALIGARSSEQVKENAGASGWTLEAGDLEKINQIAAELK